MSLKYYPDPGEVFICKYPKDMKKPEMVKRRPVISISKRLRGRSKLVTIVPLSATMPKKIMEYHIKIEFSPLLPSPWNNPICWAICDHPMTVSIERLDLIKIGKNRDGKRKYHKRSIDKDLLNNN